MEKQNDTRVSEGGCCGRFDVMQDRRGQSDQSSIQEWWRAEDEPEIRVAEWPAAQFEASISRQVLNSL